MYVSDSLDQLLTVLFLLLAVAAFVIFFVVADRTPFYWVGGVAVALRLFQYIRRGVIKRRERKKSRLEDIDI